MTENTAKSRSQAGASVQLIRSATVKITCGGKTFLTDPWLAPRGGTGSFLELGYAGQVPDRVKETLLMPLQNLPMPAEEVLAGVDAYLLTHLHPDHFDMSGYRSALDRDVPIFVQNADEAKYMKKEGFRHVEILESRALFCGVKLTKTEARHGTIEPCGPASGIIIEACGAPAIYVAGDTIWYEGTAEAIKKFRPDVIIVNAADARLISNGRLIMDDADLRRVYEAAPEAAIMAVHFDNVAHAYISREEMRRRLASYGLADKVLVPDDGQTCRFAPRAPMA